MMKKNSKKKSLPKIKSLKSLNDITREVQKIIDWNKKGIGLSADFQRSLKLLHQENENEIAYKFIRCFESESLIQEMFEWYFKLKDEASSNETIGEIKEIIEALIDRLYSEFNITLIESPNTIIKTPSPRSKYYRFDNKFSSELMFSRVLKCGLRMGNRVIVPCLLYQIEKQ